MTIRGVRIQNAPNYAISLLGCEFVIIDGVTIENAFADGIDPDSCLHVRISNCDIDSRDDAIAINYWKLGHISSSHAGERGAQWIVRVHHYFFTLGKAGKDDITNTAVALVIPAFLSGIYWVEDFR